MQPFGVGLFGSRFNFDDDSVEIGDWGLEIGVIGDTLVVGGEVVINGEAHGFVWGDVIVALIMVEQRGLGGCV